MPIMFVRSQSVAVLACVAAAGAAVLGAPLAMAQPGSGVRLEGSGKHRTDCDAMQLKPYDALIWSSLSNWSGTPTTSESTKGKVVLLVTWAGWNKQTHNAAKLAEQLHKKLADKGLIVVGIHNPREFASAAKVATDLGLTFSFAADEKGKVRSLLNVDNDPDFYLIDRAGNMRFADIETSGVENAAGILLAETPEKAGDVPGDVSKAARNLENKLQETGDTRGTVKPGLPLTVTYPEPPEESYEAVKWPAFFDETGSSEYDTLAKKIKKDRPVVELPEEGWLTPRPVTKGRITLVYIYDPLDENWLSQIPLMNRTQDAFRRDVVVIGVAVPNIAKRDGLQSEEEKKKYDEEVAKAGAQMVKIRDINHAMLSSVFKVADIDKWYAIGMSQRELGIAMLISSDNKIRWYSNPHMPGFRPAIEDMIRNDPGVIARRAAEDLKAKLEGQ